MNEESTVLRSDQEYNINVVKTSVKFFERFASMNLFLGRLCFLVPYLLALYKYKNVIKNNITSSVIHKIVCLPKTE